MDNGQKIDNPFANRCNLLKSKHKKEYRTVNPFAKPLYLSSRWPCGTVSSAGSVVVNASMRAWMPPLACRCASNSSRALGDETC